MKIATIKTAADKKAHVITRSGKRKDQGGTGVVWCCSCKSGRKCERMQALFMHVLTSYEVQLTKAGEHFFTHRIAPICSALKASTCLIVQRVIGS